MKLKKPKPILVVWHDAVSDDGAWKDAEDEHEDLHVIHTLGFLVYEDEKKLVIAMQIDIDRDGRSLEMTIPKAWTLSRRFLKIKMK